MDPSDLLVSGVQLETLVPLAQQVPAALKAQLVPVVHKVYLAVKVRQGQAVLEEVLACRVQLVPRALQAQQAPQDL